MKSGTYNKAVYWTEELQSKIDKAMSVHYWVNPTDHYREKAMLLDIPFGFYKAALFGEIVEVEYDSTTDYISKIITRLSNRKNITEDICAAIVLEGRQARVKTIWINHSLDNHKTLRTENYVNEN